MFTKPLIRGGKFSRLLQLHLGFAALNLSFASLGAQHVAAAIGADVALSQVVGHENFLQYHCDTAFWGTRHFGGPGILGLPAKNPLGLELHRLLAALHGPVAAPGAMPALGSKAAHGMAPECSEGSKIVGFYSATKAPNQVCRHAIP